MTNVEIMDKNIEIYTNEIFLLADEYIQTQLDGNVEKIKDYFRDLVLFISDRIEKIDNSDIETLDIAFSAYVRLCTKYSKLPTLELFSLLVKVNRSTFTDWSNKEYRKNTTHGEKVKEWLNTCKSFVIDELTNCRIANPNLIFIAKAAHGMRETAPIPALETTEKKVLSIDELPILSFEEEKTGDDCSKLCENETQIELPKLPD